MPLASDLKLVEDDTKSANVRTFGRLLLLLIPMLFSLLLLLVDAATDIILSEAVTAMADR
jgi:hypothetical protein